MPPAITNAEPIKSAISTRWFPVAMDKAERVVKDADYRITASGIRSSRIDISKHFPSSGTLSAARLAIDCAVFGENYDL